MTLGEVCGEVLILVAAVSGGAAVAAPPVWIPATGGGIKKLPTEGLSLHNLLQSLS